MLDKGDEMNIKEITAKECALLMLENPKRRDIYYEQSGDLLNTENNYFPKIAVFNDYKFYISEESDGEKI